MPQKESLFKEFKWQLVLAFLLIVSSAVVYIAQIKLFDKIGDTEFYFFQDLAFVPIQVLLVTLILNQIFVMREKRVLMEKLNMVIGVFFTEMGTMLIKYCSDFDVNYNDVRKKLIINNNWTERDFDDLRRRINEIEYKIESQRGSLQDIHAFLHGKRDFLLRLLENPNLLEHETFTELLWAVSHLNEELSARVNLKNLPQADHEHLSGDIKRAYVLLISEWLGYMKYLEGTYPYLYSLAVRTNPFDTHASAEIKQ